MYKRWNMKTRTAAGFSRFKKELELELHQELSQDEFIALLNKYKTQILDVIVNAEAVLAENEVEKPEVTA